MTEKTTSLFTDVLTGRLSIKNLDQGKIDSFVDDYPFSTIGHLLNYMKAKSIDSSDQNHLLQKLAMYVPDRSILEKILKTGIQSINTEISSQTISDIPNEGKDPRLDKVFFEFDFHESNIQEINQLIEDKVDVGHEETPMEPSTGNYVQWLKSLSAIQEEKVETSIPSDKDSKFNIGREEPNTRTEDDLFGGVITETLAELLANQGQIDKAISMYQRLTLIFPDKSSFFAAKIKKLKDR